MQSISKSLEVFGRHLAQCALRGLWSLEDLDQPHEGLHWIRLEADRRAAIARMGRMGKSSPLPPPNRWRNLAREWIEANPREWEAMLLEQLAQEEPDHQPPGIPTP